MSSSGKGRSLPHLQSETSRAGLAGAPLLVSPLTLVALVQKIVEWAVAELEESRPTREVEWLIAEVRVVHLEGQWQVLEVVLLSVVSFEHSYCLRH